MDAAARSVLAEKRERTLLVTIDNPATRNAISHEMAERLHAVLSAADSDPSVRVVVISGANGAFSSGHDIREMMTHPEDAWSRETNAVFLLPRSMKKPVLAAIDGPAYGAGLILALACDLLYASPGARFCSSGARLGLLPIGGQLSWLPHLAPPALAKEMLFTGSPIDAARAFQCGLVAAIFPADQLVERVVATAQVIADNAPSVVASVKEGLAVSLRDGPSATEAYEWMNAERHGSSDEAREGLAAFLEHRRPAF